MNRPTTTSHSPTPWGHADTQTQYVAGIYVDTNHLTASVLATDQADARHQMLLARPDHDQLRGTSWRRIVRWMRSPTEDEQITLAERRKS